MVLRRQFLAAGAAALGAASLPRVTSAADGVQHVPDLRFGFTPLPPNAPGFDPAGDAKALIVAGTPSPAGAPIPGTQVVGSLGPGEQHVLRVPDAWNGKLVVVGTPATRSAFASDAIWGDYLLAHGYAYAAGNKAIPYNVVVEPIGATPGSQLDYPVPFDLAQLATKKIAVRFGALQPQKVGIATWNDEFARLTRAVQSALASEFKRPTRTYAVGLSNGGAQVRSLLERHPELVDGGVDWSGPFWSPQRSLLDYLPKFLAAMPAYVSSGFTDTAARDAILSAGFPDDRRQSGAHPSLWFEYFAGQPSFYADLTVFLYALLNDPDATSSISPAGCTPNAQDPVKLPGTCAGTGLATPQARASYVPSTRARSTIASFAHTGEIGKPLISIAGTADAFITPQNNATPYLQAVLGRGGRNRYWQYLVDGGTHVDTFAPFGYGLQPQLPFAWAAFEQLVAVVERGAHPAGAGTARVVRTPSDIGST